MVFIIYNSTNNSTAFPLHNYMAIILPGRHWWNTLLLHLSQLTHLPGWPMAKLPPLCFLSVMWQQDVSFCTFALLPDPCNKR